ncbi:MAG: hypothetical protein PHQ43_16040, partial [Dehalococcoidales bacterium]|nr:hypothetical protein [Dehalococcoidales bacterium]
MGGYVGIGTTAPEHKLVVSGGHLIVSNLTAADRQVVDITTDASNNAIIGASYAGSSSFTKLILQTNSSDRLTIDTAGRVGIGTTTPDALTHIWGSHATSTLTVQQTGSGNIVDFKSTSTSIFTLKNEDMLKYRSGLTQTFGNLNDLILDDFEDNSVSNWTASDSTYSPVSATTTYFRVGDYAMAMRSASGSSNLDTATSVPSTVDWSSYERLSFWIKAIYTTTSTDATTTQLVSFQFSTGTAQTQNITIKEMNQWQYVEVDLSQYAGRSSVSWMGFRIDRDYGSPTLFIDHIRLYDSDLQAGEMFVDSQGNLVVWGQKSVEIGRTSAGQDSLPSIKAGTAIVELNQPLSVNVGGDVGFDYDIVLTNTGLAQITSAGPMKISAGDENHYENLTLTTGGTGDVIMDIVDSKLGFKVLGSSSGGYVTRVTPAGDFELSQDFSTFGGNITLNQLTTPSAPTYLSTSTDGSCANSTYYYQITAANGNGETISSATTSVSTQAASTVINLSWVPVNGAEGYYFYRSASATADSGDTASSTYVTATSSSYADDCSGDTSRSIPSSNTTGGSLTTTGAVLPSTTASFAIGSASYQWANVYAATGTFGALTASATTTIDTTAGALILNPTTYVGIGTTTPASTLGVWGTSTFMGGNVGIGTTTPSEMLSIKAVSASAIFGTYSSSSAVALYVAADGNVGIGTTAPGSYNMKSFVIYKTGADVGMTIASDNNRSGIIYFADGTSGTDSYRGHIAYNHSDDSMGFGTAATTRITINSSGYLGIGTTTPDALTHIWGSHATSTLTVQQTGSGNIVDFKSTSTSI